MINFCSLYQSHPKDRSKSNSRQRWWPEWRELSWLPDNSCYDYGARVLFGPRNKPCLKIYGKFSDNISLCCSNTYLLVPFNFLSKDSSTPTQSIICENIWIQLNGTCEARSI